MKHNITFSFFYPISLLFCHRTISRIQLRLEWRLSQIGLRFIKERIIFLPPNPRSFFSSQKWHKVVTRHFYIPQSQTLLLQTTSTLQHCSATHLRNAPCTFNKKSALVRIKHARASPSPAAIIFKRPIYTHTRARRPVAATIRQVCAKDRLTRREIPVSGGDGGKVPRAPVFPLCRCCISDRSPGSGLSFPPALARKRERQKRKLNRRRINNGETRERAHAPWINAITWANPRPRRRDYVLCRATSSTTGIYIYRQFLQDDGEQLHLSLARENILMLLHGAAVSASYSSDFLNYTPELGRASSRRQRQRDS